MKNVGVHDSYILGQARNGPLCSSFADSGFRARCGSSRFQNGSRGREDAGCSVVGDFLFGSQQVYRLRRDGLSPDGKLIQYA
jgi:hypothetical protein